MIMRRHESEEDYLEAIFALKKENGMVRSIDVAHYLDFSKPSVSRGMKLLREKGYIIVAGDGALELTDEGQALAENIYDRHQMLTAWLKELGVEDDVAAEEACRIEHDISDDTFQKLKAYILRESR